MASLVLSGDTSGSITVSAPAVAGSTTQTLVNVTGTLAPIVSGTAVTCAGQTSIDFTGIPSWAKRITVMFSGVSTSGTSAIQTRLGDSGGIEDTGYGSVVGIVNGAYVGVAGASTATSGFVMEYNSQAAAFTMSGHLTITNVSGNIWVASGVFGTSTQGTIFLFAGTKTLSDTLTQVRITTVNGTDTFDTTPSAGTINILYE